MPNEESDRVACNAHPAQAQGAAAGPFDTPRRIQPGNTRRFDENRVFNHHFLKSPSRAFLKRAGTKSQCAVEDQNQTDSAPVQGEGRELGVGATRPYVLPGLHPKGSQNTWKQGVPGAPLGLKKPHSMVGRVNGGKLGPEDA